MFWGYVFSHIVLYLVCVVTLCFSSISSLKRSLLSRLHVLVQRGPGVTVLTPRDWGRKLETYPFIPQYLVLVFYAIRTVSLQGQLSSYMTCRTTNSHWGDRWKYSNTLFRGFFYTVMQFCCEVLNMSINPAVPGTSNLHTAEQRSRVFWGSSWNLVEKPFLVSKCEGCHLPLSRFLVQTSFRLWPLVDWPRSECQHLHISRDTQKKSLPEDQFSCNAE